jgi:amphi-Trp domain-containing protein
VIFYEITGCLRGSRKYVEIRKEDCMGKETVLFKSEQKMSIGDAVVFLRKVADKLEKQQVILIQGDKEVTLNIPDRIELEVKAEKEVGKRKTKEKLEFEIEWIVGDKGKGITDKTVRLG